MVCPQKEGMLHLCWGQRSGSDLWCWVTSTKPDRDLRSDPWTSCEPPPALGWESALKPQHGPHSWTARCQTWKREERGFILMIFKVPLKLSYGIRIYLLTQYADVRAQQGLIRVPLQRGPPSSSGDWSHTDTCHGHVVLTENRKRSQMKTSSFLSLWISEDILCCCLWWQYFTSFAYLKRNWCSKILLVLCSRDRGHGQKQTKKK